MADLTVEELRFLIQDAVDAALVEYFGDPDEGLDLRPEFLEQLEKRGAGFRTGEMEPILMQDAIGGGNRTER